MALAIPVLACGAVSVGRSQAASQPASPLTKDDRLRARVQIKMAVGLPLSSAVREVQSLTGVELAVEPALQQRVVAVVLPDARPAAEVLACLAESVGARWVKLDRGYVLCRCPELAPWARMTDDELSKVNAKFNSALVRSLTPEQTAELRAGGKLEFSDLSPSQQRLCLEFARAEVCRWPGWAPDSTLGRGICITLEEVNGRTLAAIHLLDESSFLSESAGGSPLP